MGVKLIYPADEVFNRFLKLTDISHLGHSFNAAARSVSCFTRAPAMS